MVVLNPLAGIGFGVLWLGERVSAGVGGAVALCLTVAGIAVLAKRAPRRLGRTEGRERPGDEQQPVAPPGRRADCGRRIRLGRSRPGTRVLQGRGGM
jgi:hypothetical protein